MGGIYFTDGAGYGFPGGDKRGTTGAIMMATTLDTRQEAFLDWLVTPENGRIPVSQNAYAALIGVSSHTLTAWKSKNPFNAEWRKRVDSLQADPSRTQQLLDNLYNRSLAGDNNAAKLYLQATGRLAPVQIAVTTTTNVTELSDAALAELIATSAVIEQQNRASLVGNT